MATPMLTGKASSNTLTTSVGELPQSLPRRTSVASTNSRKARMISATCWVTSVSPSATRTAFSMPSPTASRLGFGAARDVVQDLRTAYPKARQPRGLSAARARPRC
ncbi:MAG TPA: hypothetical protein VGN81_17205 [Pseudonocardiaceae bacterium]|jgi:hypothetical protein